MRTPSPNRSTSILTALAVFVLALTVLGWGTGYKLSLYHPSGSPSSTIPAAKLLSQKERSTFVGTTERLLPGNPGPQTLTHPPAILLITLMLALRLMISACMREIAGENARERQSAHTSFFSFRPPPALLPSL